MWGAITKQVRPAVFAARCCALWSLGGVARIRNALHSSDAPQHVLPKADGVLEKNIAVVHSKGRSSHTAPAPSAGATQQAAIGDRAAYCRRRRRRPNAAQPDRSGECRPTMIKAKSWTKQS